MKVVDYILIGGADYEDFLKQVRLKLTEGWQPVGGATSPAPGCYLQAMVKYEE
jgi:hypothetical protein